MADGFLGRWAKRKNDALQGKPLDEPAPSFPAASAGNGVNAVVPPAQPARAVVAGNGPGASSETRAAGQDPAAEQTAPLTLDDVEGLTKDSDFKPFMNKAVEPGVRNAAMKKLFADPHFNVMDRMDIYIDDYSQPDPLPASMLRQMASAKFLKLFDEEEDAPAQSPAAVEASALADPDDPKARGRQPDATDQAQDTPNGDNPQPPIAAAELDPHEDNHAHSDLRLQPDHAAESPGPGRSAA